MKHLILPNNQNQPEKETLSTGNNDGCFSYGRITVPSHASDAQDEVQCQVSAHPPRLVLGLVVVASAVLRRVHWFSPLLCHF